MSKQTALCLLASVFFTAVITVLGLVIVLALSVSTAAGTGGISAAAGGVSNSVFLLLMAAVPVLFVLLFLTFRKVFRRRE